MSLLVESTLKVSLIILVAMAATVLLRSRSAALRHWMLSAALACAAGLPVIQVIGPSWTVRIDLPAVAPPERPDAPESLAASASAGGQQPVRPGCGIRL
jgi:hypothetical protein